MKRIALGVQYDGTPWQGWQTQLHGQTVQDRLEFALKKFTLLDVATTCAGRTDSGVHALEQVAHFDIDLDRTPYSWVGGINTFLPPSIAVRWACEVEPSLENSSQDAFHARFSARSRCYHYVLYNNSIRSPLLVGKAGWVFRPLNVALMRQAAHSLLGTHDFSAFRAAGCQAKTPIKSMHEITITQNGDLIIFTLRASAFLHHMVRNIVGSLIYVGIGKKEPTWLNEILQGRDRTKAAPTFMPDGLYLAKIEYEPKWCLPQQMDGCLPWF